MSLLVDTQDIIPSGPTSAYIEITSYCNNRCAGCGNVFADSETSHAMVPNPLEIEQWKAVLLKLKPYVTNLRFTGGEPTLYPGLQDVLTYVWEMGISFGLFTNGRWKHPERLIEYLRQNPYFKGMLISLHGSDAEDHEAFSGIKGSFEETIANIKLATRYGIKVDTNLVVTKYNYDKVENVYRFVRNMGVSRMVVARYLGNAMPDIEASPKQLQQAIKTAEDLRQRGAILRYSGCIPQCFMNSGAFGCTAGYTFFSIDPWGNVRPCNHSTIALGNLLEHDVSSIWYSEKMAIWRNAIPSECKLCTVFSKCHGGCHATAMAYGQITDPLMEKGSANILQTLKRKRIVLNKNEIPISHCFLRPEPFGYLLIHDSSSLPVSYDAKSILEACDGTVSLGGINDRFGQKGLDFIGALIERGFISLKVTRVHPQNN